MSYLDMGEGFPFKTGEHAEHLPTSPVVFYGRPRVYFLAVCVTCAAEHGGTPMPQYFATQAERDQWADGHRGGTGHTINEAVEVKP